MAKKVSDRKLLEKISKDLATVKKKVTNLEKAQALELEEEETAEDTEKTELEELKKLEQLEEEIKADVKPHPLAKITYRDVSKGIIGSFFGIVGHFAFFYGNKIAYDLSIFRASMLIITSLIILILFVYFSGFRKLAKDRHHHYVLVRVLVIFLTAHIVITFVLTLFGRITFDMSFIEIYKNIAAVSILSVMGAATADLIGGE